MSTYVLENVLSTDAGYNYKAVFADAEKNLFGFMAYGDSIEYKMFTYDEAEGFKEVFSKILLITEMSEDCISEKHFIL